MTKKYPSTKRKGRKLFPDSDVKKKEIPGLIWEELKGIGKMFLGTGAKGLSTITGKKKKKKLPKWDPVYGKKYGKKVELNF